MKTLNNLPNIILGVLIVLVTVSVSETKTNENKNSINSELDRAEITFTLNGTVTSDHPELSWNTCAGTNLYELHRLPAPALGGASKSATFSFSSSDSHLDVDVNGAQLGSGLYQVRYVVKA
ncbi:hypothetical protein [Gracilimonas sp. BCB1]|uniref:hypothetical protein n=1 Tax=Gracilimonas sp. BCB1 TaxID=3152362 RepID=UPI0032D99A58